MFDELTKSDPIVDPEAANDDAAEIRYSLTTLGEALVADRVRIRFRGFGPCSVATLKIAG